MAAMCEYVLYVCTDYICTYVHTMALGHSVAVVSVHGCGAMLQFLQPVLYAPVPPASMSQIADMYRRPNIHTYIHILAAEHCSTHGPPNVRRKISVAARASENIKTMCQKGNCSRG